jgi:chromosome segregation ATPase
MFNNAVQIIKKTPTNLETKKELAFLKEEQKKLIDESFDIKKSIKDAYLKLDSINVEIDEAKDQLDKVLVSIKKKTDKNKEIEFENDRITKVIDNKQNKIEEADRYIEEAKNKKILMAERMEAVLKENTEINAKKKELDKKEKELNILEKKIALEASVNDSTIKDIKKLEKSLKEDKSILLDSIKAFENEKAEKEQILSDKAKKINSQIGYLERKEAELKARELEIENLEVSFNSKVKDKEKELNIKQTKIDEKETKYQDAKLLIAEEAAKIKKQYRKDVVQGLGIDI